MPKQRSNSALLQEGSRSYHKALFAVMQFQQQAQETIRAVIDERIGDLAEALKLGKADLDEGLTPYAKPANLAQTWDGSEAEVGLRYPGKPWEAKWGIWFYFGIEDGEAGGVLAYVWFKEPGPVMRKLASLGVEGLEINGCQAWIWEAIGESPDGFAAAIQRALDTWIEVWRKAGGIQQFLPPRKVPEVQAGK
jgi:hypothetical protein